MKVYLVCELGWEECEHTGVFSTLAEAQAKPTGDKIEELELGVWRGKHRTWYRDNPSSGWRALS